MNYKEALLNGSLDAELAALYGADALSYQRTRYAKLAETHTAAFGEQELFFFTAPGRTELAGNHTDHQHGRVLAGAVTLDAIAAVSIVNEPVITLHSEGYAPISISLNDLSVHADEKNTTASLVRGVAAAFTERGASCKGLNIAMTSDVFSGSGLSSSACFEVLIGCILNDLFFESKLTKPEIAIIGQFAENVYFGKPCGLMDQTACAVGGCVTIDFIDPKAPVIEPIAFAPKDTGYALVIIDSGADHADLTEDFASIPTEMRAAASVFGQEILRGVTMEDLLKNAQAVRKAAGDRAFIRAWHFIQENDRVVDMVNAMKAGKMEDFLSGVIASGRSSAFLLQNIHSDRMAQEQSVTIAIAAAEAALNGKGAVRVHGGGFAGTIQAYVPFEMLDSFVAFMEQTLFAGCCHILGIRKDGCRKVF